MKRIVQRYVIVVSRVRMWLAAVAMVVTACGVEDHGPPPDAGMNPRATCGDHVCESTETLASCPTDCTCGNHTCEASETPASCPADCPVTVCDNGTCEAGETPTSCPSDCGAKMTTRNSSSYYVYHLYVYGCTATSEGPDLLAGKLIYPGYELTLTKIPPGCYLFHATTADGSGWRTPTGVTLKSAETLVWTLRN